MVHFTLTTLSGNTKIKINVDPSASLGALIRLVEMAFKAHIRGQGQVEERLDFHVDSLFCSFGNKGDKMVKNMRTSGETVAEKFEDQVAATVIMGKTLADGDAESEDGQSLFDWSKPPAPASAGNKRAADADADSGGTSKKAKQNNVAEAEDVGEGGVAAAPAADSMTFFSLEDNVQLTLPLGRQEDGSVDTAQLIQKVEAAYVDNRKANTINDAFGLWEAERPIEITALIFFGLKDRSGGSFVKTVTTPFPAKLLPASAAQPEAAELGVPLDIQGGDYIAFRFKRHARTAQTVSAFPQGFVRSMTALAVTIVPALYRATMAADTSKPAASSGLFGGGSGSAAVLTADKELVLSKLKGHPQLLAVWKEMFKVSEGGKIVVLDPSKKVDAAEGSGQCMLSGCCEGEWRVGTLCTKFGKPTQILDSLVVCHNEYENVAGLSALIKKKGTSGWKKAGEVKTSDVAGIFDASEYKAPEDGQGNGPGAYPKLNWQPLAICSGGTYGARPNANEVFPVYTKDRGGKIQAVKIMFLGGNDYK